MKRYNTSAELRGKGKGSCVRLRLRRNDRKGLRTQDAFWKNALAKCAVQGERSSGVCRAQGRGSRLRGNDTSPRANSVGLLSSVFRLPIFRSSTDLLPRLSRVTRHLSPVTSLLLLALLVGCKPAPVKETVKAEVVKVRVVPVLTQNISLPVRSGGIVATSEEVKLSFKTGGIVAHTYVKEGDPVKQGQLLAILNLSEINAQVNQAKNGFEKAQRDFNRAKNLYADSVATLEQMQNAETALNVSKSALDMTQFNLSHSRITAPKSGVILKQMVKENELTSPGYPVYALGISGKSWIIRTALSDRDIVKINIGDSANVSIDAWPGEPFTAKISQIDEASNPMTGTYEIELRLSETVKKLASGFIANIEIYPSRKETYSLIPMASVVEADGRTGYVYEVSPAGIAKKVKVTIATLYGEQAAISGGLENVKEVVTEGAAYITDGTPVEIKKQ